VHEILQCVLHFVDFRRIQCISATNDSNGKNPGKTYLLRDHAGISTGWVPGKCHAFGILAFLVGYCQPPPSAL
jgi:hypothetical protein